jgi:hypothetical protein
MICVFRHHLPSAQAHILAGVLSSGGISAAVTGDIADQLYGGTPMLDCVVIVPEDEIEEAEAFLRADFTGEPPDSDIPAETCPSDGDPPGIGTLLCATLCLAPLAALIPALLVELQVLGNHPSSLQPVLLGMARAYFESLLLLIIYLPFFAIGTGLSLRIIRGYRSGSLLFLLMVKGLLLFFLLPIL